MSSIKHILFDLSEVLMNGILDLPYAIQKAVQKKTYSLENFDLALKIHLDFSLTKSKGLHSLFRGDLSEDDFWEKFLLGNDYPLTVGDLKEITRKNFWQYEDTNKILNTLKSNDYDLTLFSDHGLEWIRYIEYNFPFLSFFNNKIYSFDSHFIKKEERSFEYTIDEAHLNPKRTLFIDDLYENTELAQESGIGYVHCYRNPERLLRYFKELEIKGFS